MMNTMKMFNVEALMNIAGGKVEGQPKYAIGDVVEVYDGLGLPTTHKGKITKIKEGSSHWMYYVEFDAWYMINGWQTEADIQCKVN